MKRLFLFALFAFISICSFANDKAEKQSQAMDSTMVNIRNNDIRPDSKSNAAKFSLKYASFLKTEVYYLGKVKGITFEVFVRTHIDTNFKFSYLCLTTKFSNEQYTGIIDSDEMDDFIRCLNYINYELIPTIPYTYTHAKYISRDDVIIGAYCYKGENDWTMYVRPSVLSLTKFFNRKFLPDIITLVKEAKGLMTSALEDKNDTPNVTNLAKIAYKKNGYIAYEIENQKQFMDNNVITDAEYTKKLIDNDYQQILSKKAFNLSSANDPESRIGVVDIIVGKYGIVHAQLVLKEKTASTIDTAIISKYISDIYNITVLPIDSKYPETQKIKVTLPLIRID